MVLYYLDNTLVHYLALIYAFGAPNRLCSSITELKHIEAVKEPYCHSSCFKALGQMLLTNQQMDKLAASHVDFTKCSMLNGTSALGALSIVMIYTLLLLSLTPMYIILMTILPLTHSSHTYVLSLMITPLLTHTHVLSLMITPP